MRLFKLLEKIINEVYQLHHSRKYKKNVVKYSNKPANIKLLKDVEKQLKNDGKVEGHGIHSIRQPIKSEYENTSMTGWKVLYISKSDDLRLGYLKHKDGTIELKFGKANDIGYSH